MRLGLGYELIRVGIGLGYELMRLAPQITHVGILGYELIHVGLGYYPFRVAAYNLTFEPSLL